MSPKINNLSFGQALWRGIGVVLLILSLITVWTYTAGAQTTAERLNRLDSLVGTAKFYQPAIPCGQMESSRPNFSFPSGDYDLAYRNRQFGCAFDPVVSSIQEFRSRIAALEARPASSISTGTGFDNGTGVTITQPGEITLRSNLNHAPQQGGLTDSFHGIISMNGYDGGFRLLQNWQLLGSKYLPGGTIGMDSRATLSYNWWPAELGGESPDNGPFTNEPGSALYNAYRGQTLIIDGGAQAAYDYRTGGQLYRSRALLIASQREGWPIYFAVSPVRVNGYPTNKAVMKLNSDGSANPVEVVIDGQLQRLVPCDGNHVCFSSGSRGTAAPRGAGRRAPEIPLDSIMARGAAPTGPRDVTRALNLARTIRVEDQASGKALAELIQILVNIDARTGRRDPSVR